MVLVGEVYFIFEGNLIFVKQIVEKITTNNESRREGESCFDFAPNSPSATLAPSSWSETGKKIESQLYDVDKGGLSVDGDDNVLNKTLSPSNSSSGPRNDNLLQSGNPSLSRSFAEMNSHDELEAKCREKVNRCAERANKLKRVREAIEFLHSLHSDRPINGGDSDVIKRNRTFNENPHRFQHEDKGIKISNGHNNYHSWTVDSNMDPIRDKQISEFTFNEEIVRNSKKQPFVGRQVSGNLKNTCKAVHSSCFSNKISTSDKVDVIKGTIREPPTSGQDQIKGEENIGNVRTVKNGTKHQNLEVSRCLGTGQRKAVLRKSRSLVQKIDRLKSASNVNEAQIDETANCIWKRDFNQIKYRDDKTRSLEKVEAFTNATKRRENIVLREELDGDQNKASGEHIIIESSASVSPVCKGIIEEEDIDIRSANENKCFGACFELFEDGEDKISIHSSHSKSLRSEKDAFLDIGDGIEVKETGSSAKIENSIEQSKCNIIQNSVPSFRIISSFDLFSVDNDNFGEIITNVQNDAATSANFLEATNCGVLTSTPKTHNGVMENSQNGIMENSRNRLMENPQDGLMENSPDGIMENSQDGIMENSPDGIMESSQDGIMENSKDGIMENSQDYTRGSAARSLLFSMEKATTGRRGNANDSGGGAVEDQNFSYAKSDGESQQSDYNQSDQSVQMLAKLSSKLFKLDGLLKEIKSSTVFGCLSENLSFPITGESSILESQKPDTFAVNKSGSISDELDEVRSDSPRQAMSYSIEKFDHSSKNDAARTKVGRCDYGYVSHQREENLPKMETDCSDGEESNGLFKSNDAMLNRRANDDVKNNESLKMNVSTNDEGKAYYASKRDILTMSAIGSQVPREVIDLTQKGESEIAYNDEDVINEELEKKQRRKQEFDVIDLTVDDSSSSSDDTWNISDTDLHISVFNQSPREKKAKTSRWSNYVFDFSGDASSPEKQDRYDRFANDRSDIFPAVIDIDSDSSLRLSLERSASSPFYS